MFKRMGTVGQALLAALVASSALGYALAQGNQPSTVEVIKVDPVGKAAQTKPLSPSKQAQTAASALESASASCSAQAQALKSAKRDKDIIRATCLDDKLSQCNANLQNMKRRRAALKEAIADGDTGRANHESTVIGVLSQKFKMLTQAANQCVGQDLFDTGDSQNKVEVNLFAPDESPVVVAVVPDWPIPYIPPPVSGVN